MAECKKFAFFNVSNSQNNYSDENLRKCDCLAEKFFESHARKILIGRMKMFKVSTKSLNTALRVSKKLESYDAYIKI